MYDFEKIKDDLKNSLTEFRYLHSLKVAEEAKSLARIYHKDERGAYFTGLIHDIAKDFSDEENLYYARKYRLDSKLLEDDYKDIVHADIGALVAKERYGVDDNISKAIEYHTIGNVLMNDFAKIIFIADKIGRKSLSPNLLKVKELAYQGKLDSALLLCLEKEKEKLESLSKKMHPNTILLMKKLRKSTC